MSNSQSPLISIVIPVFNEETNVRRVYDETLRVFAGLQESFGLEFIFTDNHSTDHTFDELARLATADARVKVVRFNRNYGFQRSLLTAYGFASGDAAIQIDCDLQDPPALFSEFLALWKKGHDVVVGIRRQRKESRALTFGRRLFYSLLNAISEHPVTPNAGDFRLVDRHILDQLKTFHDMNPYVRGLVSSLTVNEARIPYDRSERLHGDSKFPLRKLIGFAFNGIYSHSVLPLKIASWAGLIIALSTAALTAFYIISALTVGQSWPSGFATTTILILFGVSLNATFLGILGEYISRIYQQVRHRPLTVIERSINVDTGVNNQ